MGMHITNIEMQQDFGTVYTTGNPSPLLFARGSRRVTIQGELIGSYEKFKELCLARNNVLSIITEDGTFLGAEEAKLLASMLQDIKKLLPAQPTLSVVETGKPLLSYILSELTDITNAIKQQNINSNR